jgi:hypothetical protein
MWLTFVLACTLAATPQGGDDADAPGGDPADPLGGVTLPSPWDIPVREAELQLSDEAIAGLATRHDADLPEVPGVWLSDGERLDVAVRLRGGVGSFRTLEGKPSLGLDFGEFTEGGTFLGVRRVLLSNLVQDGTLAGEHLAWALHDAAGGVTPRHGWVRLRINGAPYGLFGLVESVDEDFVETRFDDDDGPLYAGGGDLTRSQLADLRLEEGEDDGRALLTRLVAELDAARPDTLLGVIGRNFDVDALLDTLAFDLVVGNPDAYVTRANNYFLYRSPDTGTWTMVPWAADQAFVAELPVTWRYAGRLHADCRLSPDCAARLDARTLALLDVWDDMDMPGLAERTVAALSADCAAETRAELDCAEAGRALVDFVRGRTDAVRDELAP